MKAAFALRGLSRRLISFSVETEGVYKKPGFRAWVNKDSIRVSPWHDVPLRWKNGLGYYYVNEIPKGTRAKMEIDTTVGSGNPIIQDTVNGKPRQFKDPIPFNYGALPQTFEDPEFEHPDTGFPGDGDPLDVVELSDTNYDVGEVIPVNVLGILGLIDEGETDWKLLVMHAGSNIRTLDTLKMRHPTKIGLVREWFRSYKMADGKPPNEFAFDGDVRDKKYAERIIDETHESWKFFFLPPPNNLEQ